MGLATVMYPSSSQEKLLRDSLGKRAENEDIIVAIVLFQVKVLSAGAGKCDMRVTIREEDANTSGLAHNGFIATLVDVASASALRTHPTLITKSGENDNITFVTSNMHMSYVVMF